LLLSGSAVLQGRWVLWLKHLFDRRYLRRYQVHPPVARRPAA
jgi:hypothetical protein